MSDHAKGSDRHLDLVTMGCRWVLDVSALEVSAAREMSARWQRCRDLAASTTVVLDEDPMTITARTSAAAYDLSRELTRRGLTRLTGRATLLHAAALADEHGRSLVLVAPSGGGKSTAARVLGQRLGYVSDESVILLEDHRIAPHPKPPSLVTDPERPFHKEEPSPEEIGLGPTPPAPWLGRLLTLTRDPQLAEPSIETVGVIDQILAILPETSSTWLLPDGLDRLARAATAGGAPARLRYAEIASCHDLVLAHLGRESPDAPTWEHVPPVGSQRLEYVAGALGEDGGEGDDGGEAVADTDVLVRGHWSDAIAAEGEVLVLAGPRPLRLAGPGAILWRAAVAPGRRVDELAAAVVAELGEHPQARSLVQTAASDLLRHGALRRALP
ncbi:hypothetical protein [Janibacter sp. GS2]|uniref:hypothetical protein n=1 Tax=Janibacter sp. GS2 TaxID=3442646 RepID=UPI003EBC9722